MVYSRIVKAVHGENCSLVSPKKTTRIFVVSDVVCFFVQMAGSGLLATGAKNTKLGDTIVVVGLIIQIMIFLVFVMCCGIFHRRYGDHLAKTGTLSILPWKSSLYMLYGTSTAILGRNVFRVVEFIMGFEAGFFANNEWPLYVFDAALMILVMAGFFLWYPSHLQPKSLSGPESSSDMTTLDVMTGGKGV